MDDQITNTNNTDVIEGEMLTPLPRKQGESITMDFIDAFRKLIEGKKIARISWEGDDYCLMKDYKVSIYTKGSFHDWIINDGDVEGSDWFIKE